jgi:hypothetical protein
VADDSRVAKLAPPGEATAPAARRFAALALGFGLTLLSSLAAINIAVDPWAQWGSPVGIPPRSVPDVFQEKLELYRAYDPAPSIVVLGSSRAANFDPDDIPGAAPGTGFNFGLLAVRSREVDIVLRWLVAQEDSPERVLLVLDQFGARAGARLEILASPAYDDYTGHPRPASVTWTRLQDSIGVHLTTDTVKSVVHALGPGTAPAFGRSDPDGVWRRPALEQSIAAGSFNLTQVIERDYRHTEMVRQTGQDAPFDLAAAQGLAAAVSAALDAGIAVDVVVPSYAPLAIEKLETLDDPWLRTREWIEVLRPVCTHGMRLFDYTQGAGLGLDPNGYWDGSHMMRGNAAVILRAMDAGIDDACQDSFLRAG